MDAAQLDTLRKNFAGRLQENVLMSGYTSARMGGPADGLLIVWTSDEMVHAVQLLGEMGLPFVVLGGGSNILVSDRGIRAVVIINRSRTIRFQTESDPPVVWAESGAQLNDIARRAARLSLSGLEWASNIPGSLGGAVYGNAGAFEGSIAGNLIEVEIFHSRHGRETWPAKRMAYDYRDSALKHQRESAVILAAELRLAHGEKVEIQEMIDQFSSRRRKNTPRAASMGSVFKNPPGGSAGRLIESVGLKGARIGSAEISPRHANFFLNRGKARAADFMKLIELARKKVHEKHNVDLELEIELIGDWQSQEI